MNERGFFTIVGLCLLLVAAISIKGVHEFEANYSSGITIFQAEHELQNAADSYLINAIKTGSTANQIVHSKKFGDINIEIYCQSNIGSNALYIYLFDRKYLSADKKKDTPINEDGTLDAGNLSSPADETPEYLKKATVWISVASCDNPFIAGKIYRRSLAYILEDDNSKTLHFMSDLTRQE